ncbi:MAG TPA: outer membrane beta-barrel family protein [Agriterribacter sp.]|nr:outer membrane beta-barrel family protein [Agriterribacter sp.]HRQ49208.1 outer membrane beta-barrel family protein [Agriterribacter sp.]
MKKAVCPILLVGLIFPSFGQQASALFSCNTPAIRGIVVNEENTPLPYATVKLWINSIENEATVCDSNGHFLINMPQEINGSILLGAYYLKSQSEKFSVFDKRENIVLVVIDRDNLLSGITVTAQKTLLQRKADRFVFTPKKELTKGATALDLMRHAPIVQFDNRSETFSIIGKPGTIVYLNNKKSDIPNDMLIQMLRSLPASDIKSVEIITNPGSEYGANITSGIINIILKKELYEGWMGNLAVQMVQSAYNTTILNGAVSYRRKQLTVQVMPFLNRSYNYYTTSNTLCYVDNTREQQQKEYFRRYTVYGGGLNADYEINKHSIISLKSWNSVVYGKSTDQVNTEYGTTSPDKVESLLSSDLKGNDHYSYNFGNINYRWDPTSKNSLYVDLNIDYNHFIQKRENNGSFQYLNASGDTLPYPFHYSSHLPQRFNNLSAKAELGLRLNKKYQLTFGGQISTTKVDNNLTYYNKSNNTTTIDSTIFNHFTYNERYGGIFANLTGQITQKLQAALGFRLEGTTYVPAIVNKNIQMDSSYLKLYPSFGIAYAPDPKYQLGYSYSRKITRPNIETLFPGRTYNTPGYFIENNPFLQPSIINNHELSLLMKNKYSFVLSYTSARNRYAQFVTSASENNASLMKQTYLNYGTEEGLNLMFNGSWSLFKGFWEIHFTPALSYNHYNGTVEDRAVEVKNWSATVVYDNYLYLSRKKGWTGFVTFKYNTPSRGISGTLLNTTTSLDLELKKVYQHFSFYLIASDVYRGSSFIRSKRYASPTLIVNNLDIDNYTKSLVFKIRYNFGNGQVKTIKDRHTANEEIKNRAN